jgi:hypothetical protein
MSLVYPQAAAMPGTIAAWSMRGPTFVSKTMVYSVGSESCGAGVSITSGRAPVPSLESPGAGSGISVGIGSKSVGAGCWVGPATGEGRDSQGGAWRIAAVGSLAIRLTGAYHPISIDPVDPSSAR